MSREFKAGVMVIGTIWVCMVLFGSTLLAFAYVSKLLSLG